MSHAAHWRGRARALRRRVNLGWWLSAWWPFALALSVAASLALVLARRAGVPQSRFLLLLALAHLALACGVWLGARRRFYRAGDALVLLDTALAFDCRLLAAESGVGDFPSPDARPARPLLRWRWPVILGPVLLSVLALLVAATVPVSPPLHARADAEPPPEWREMETWLGTLDEAGVVEPQALATWEERLATLRRRPPEQWYDHSSLEASESLKEDLAGALRSLARGLDSAEEGLAALALSAEGTDVAPEAERRMQGAISVAARGGLPMNRELAERLRHVGLTGGHVLSAEERARLQRRLREGAEKSRSALLECRAGHRMCLGRNCGGGRGSIARGPGPAPLTLSFERSYAGTQAVEALNNPNVGDAALGDLLRVERGRHAVDEGAFRGALRGGASASRGQGGEAVWRHSVTPEEREVLERYFK